MTALDEARRLTGFGWPVIPIRAGTKTPLTRRGVKDASTDERTLLHWFERWPDAGLAIACGRPGPTVLDVDDLVAGRETLRRLAGLDGPTVATDRGQHIYLAGSPAGTIKLGYGELRGRGSYVLCPPSVHPSGKLYTWLVAPRRDAALLEVPSFLTANGETSWGKGAMKSTVSVAPGAMYDHLGDLAVRLARAGITNPDVIDRVLVAEFDAVHVVGADYGGRGGRRDTRRIAEWAAGSRIATSTAAAERPHEVARALIEREMDAR